MDKKRIQNKEIDGIRCYGIAIAENPNFTAQSPTLKKGMKSLADIIRMAHYPFLRQRSHCDENDELSYCIFNIPLDTLMYYAGQLEQTSFIYGRVQEDGSVLHEYWEKENAKASYEKSSNPYVKTDEEPTYIEIDAEGNFNVMGKKFNCAIPFRIFEAVQHGIKENCRKNGTKYSESLCNWLTESVGHSGWMARGWAYRGLYMLE